MHNQSKKMENFCKKVARKNNVPIYVNNLVLKPILSAFAKAYSVVPIF